MEEMKREFAGKLYRKACEIAEFYEEQMDSEDDDEVFDIEECLVELCQLVLRNDFLSSSSIDDILRNIANRQSSYYE